MKTITSRFNDEIKEVAALGQAKERKKLKQFIAEGLRTCSTLINSPIELVQLYVTEEMYPSIKHLVHENDVTLVSPHVLEKMSQATTPSGILGVFTIPKPENPGPLKPGMVLARIADPGNMGTLIRTCAALDVQSVVIVEGTDPWSPKVVQASAGTIGNVTISSLRWDEVCAHKGALKLCALVTTGGKKAEDIDASTSLLVVGNEAEGIPMPWLANCDTKVTISMPGNAESLNAAVAGSIALYVSKFCS
jgi:RNA methyltransferase, TrmH family